VNFRQWYYEAVGDGAAFIGTPGISGSGTANNPDFANQDKWHGHGFNYGMPGEGDKAERMYGIKRRLLLKRMKKMIQMDK
jgi:hypothetical protein